LEVKTRFNDKIRKLECSEEFRRLNFEPSDYIDERGKEQPMYEMTRDGWTFLVLGFTGKKAARFKEYDFQEDKDYVTVTENLVSGGRRKEYHVSIPMAKELSMVEGNEKGKQARQISFHG